MSTSSSPGGPSKSSNPNDPNPAPNPGGAPTSSQDGRQDGQQDDHGFARPAPGFNPNPTEPPFSDNTGQGLLNPANGVAESVELEIARRIAELEAARGGPVTDKEKERISSRIRTLRQGEWLEGLKLQLAGQDTVPVRYFNRLASEHENTIGIVAQIIADADRRVAERDAEIEKLSGRGNAANARDDALIAENALLRKENEDLREQVASNRQARAKLRELIWSNGSAVADAVNRAQDLQKELDSANQSLDTSRKTASSHYDEVQALRQLKIDVDKREQTNKDEIRRLRAEQEESRKALRSANGKWTNLLRRAEREQGAQGRRCIASCAGGRIC
ncbi:hypothetical protein O1611_g4706 [Lasiodiplodia mahajangana]|uniref:Uncharacterized protein n=1 Tax=Lasiodiplodia mahajangana TaxID=1108764 RepID=A0ACC2JN40_9PEZI|nr:hypothetical protein O1611_g4706 [Lasiodiplodia mahajangana]